MGEVLRGYLQAPLGSTSEIPLEPCLEAISISFGFLFSYPKNLVGSPFGLYLALLERDTICIPSDALCGSFPILGGTFRTIFKILEENKDPLQIPPWSPLNFRSPFKVLGIPLGQP